MREAGVGLFARVAGLPEILSTEIDNIGLSVSPGPVLVMARDFLDGLNSG
jgi:hypothetical protein